MTTENTVHGHKVIELVAENEGLWNMEELKREMSSRFGVQTKYETCFATGMDTNALINALIERNKLVLREDRLFVKKQNVC